MIDMQTKNVFIGIWIIIAGNIGSVNCFHENSHSPVTGITVIKKTPMPITDTDTVWKAVEDYYSFYYYKGLVMYKFNYVFDSLQNHEFVSRDTRHFYFVFNKDSSYGYKYYIVNSGFNDADGRFFKDSVLHKHVFGSKVFDTLATLKPDSIFRNINGYVKFYKDPPTPDGSPKIEENKIYFYYSNSFQNISETFSKRMDQEKNMKLYKIEVKAGGGLHKELNVRLPKREYLLEMKKIGDQDFSQEKRFFKKYENIN